jgi:hypothetical protein
MRLRRRDFRVTVNLQAGERPVIIGMWPGFTLEASLDDARRLALDLADAIEQLHRGGGRC